MEEKKVIKISLSTFLLLIAIIVIIVMGVFIYKLNNDKSAETQKSKELQNQVNSLNETISNFQGKINTISETINSNNNEIDKSENLQRIPENENAVSANNTNSIIMFDASKSINSNEKNYTLSCQGNAGIWVTVDSTQKNLTFSFTPTKVVEFYSLNWASDRNDMINSKINFDKKIVSVFFGEMGQDSLGDTLFILLEDATVEYIPIVHMFNHTQSEVKSYGKINGVSNVEKFTLSNTTNGVTILGIKKDGTFYDLWYALKDTGNY